MIRLLFFFCLLVFFACTNPTSPDSSTTAQANISNNDTMTPPAKKYPVDYIMGKYDPVKHEEFVRIHENYASSSSMYLRKDAYDAFIEMHKQAKADGINLKIISATRPFSHQKSIWEAKWDGKRKVSGKDLSKTIADPVERALKILEYSSMPGTSRHHWGTDIDINNLENSYFASGQGKLEYEWLTKNAPSFGYNQPYTPKGESLRKDGYNEEKWHWSYTPVSIGLTQQYANEIPNSAISGFKGSEVAATIGIVEKYVLGVHGSCK